MNNKGMLEVRDFIFRMISEWKWFVLSVVVCLTIAVLYIKTANPVYRVNANVVIKDNESSNPASGMSALKSFGFGLGGSLDINDEIEVMNSFSLMRQAVKELGLNKTETEKLHWFKNVDRYKSSVYNLSIDNAIIDTLSTPLFLSLKTDKKGLTNIKLEDAVSIHPK